MTPLERQVSINKMRQASNQFYTAAINTGNHAFIEFTGLMNEYIQCCQLAHEQDVDFSETNTHTGSELPIPEHSMDYINEKLECIFTGRSVLCDYSADYAKNLDWLLQKITFGQQTINLKTTVALFQEWMVKTPLNRKQFVLGCLAEVYDSLVLSGSMPTSIVFSHCFDHPLISFLGGNDNWHIGFTNQSNYIQQIQHGNDAHIYYLGDGKQSLRIKFLSDAIYFFIVDENH